MEFSWKHRLKFEKPKNEKRKFNSAKMYEFSISVLNLQYNHMLKIKFDFNSTLRKALKLDDSWSVY